MTPWQVLRRLARVAFIAAAALAGACASALSISPPPAIALQFEAGTDRLTLEGLFAVDELAVRAGQCPPQALAVHVLPAARVEPALTQRRIAVVQKRLDRLGLKLAVERKPLREEDTVAPRHRGMLLADVGADDDVWCDLREGSRIFEWAAEMGRYVDGVASTLPAFWQRLSEPGRMSLAAPLAIAAVCGDTPECARHPQLFHWLAERVLNKAARGTRRWWLLQLWARAEDADVERFRRRWAMEPLTLKERASHAHEMVASGLPWPVIEQRLLEPGVMAEFGEQPMISGGPGPHWLLHVASRRNQLDVFDRLIEAAGPVKACFVSQAFRDAGWDQAQFEAWRPRFAAWARGAAAPYQPRFLRGLPDTCDPVAEVLKEAFCGWNPADVATRYETIWDVLLASGVTHETPAVRQLTQPAPEGVRQTCRLEPVPGQASRFRSADRP